MKMIRLVETWLERKRRYWGKKTEKETNTQRERERGDIDR